MPKVSLDRFLARQRYKCRQLLREGFPAVEFNIQEQFQSAELSINQQQISACPPSFDGLLCWPTTVASKTAKLPCPPRSFFGYQNSESSSADLSSYYLSSSSSSSVSSSYYYDDNFADNFDENVAREEYDDDDLENDDLDNENVSARSSMEHLEIATKTCLVNGQWYQNSERVAWSNYSLCTPRTSGTSNYANATESGVMDLEGNQANGSPLLDRWLPIIRMVSQIGYTTSFATLIIAMIVFSFLRKLRNPRNRLHMHLFASFIMRAFMALLKDLIFIDGIGLAWDIVLVDGKTAFIKERNTWLCKTITSMWQYFIVANYAWILMEGLYLHNLVFLALCADADSIVPYILLGWGLPVVVVVPWIIIRATIEDTLCWTTHNNPKLFLVIRIPIMISILFNFLLFVNIVRVLLVKLKTSVYLQRKKMQYGKWAKSTLVLVPLFGAHYTLFLGLSYYKDRRVELVWLFCDQFFASFQGAFVALLYCLLNGEVRAEIKRAWKTRRSKRNADSSIGSHNRDFPARRTRNMREYTRRHQHFRRESEVSGPSEIAMRELSRP